MIASIRLLKQTTGRLTMDVRRPGFIGRRRHSRDFDARRRRRNRAGLRKIQDDGLLVARERRLAALHAAQSPALIFFAYSQTKSSALEVWSTKMPKLRSSPVMVPTSKSCGGCSSCAGFGGGGFATATSVTATGGGRREDENTGRSRVPLRISNGISHSGLPLRAGPLGCSTGALGTRTEAVVETSSDGIAKAPCHAPLHHRNCPLSAPHVEARTLSAGTRTRNQVSFGIVARPAIQCARADIIELESFGRRYCMRREPDQADRPSRHRKQASLSFAKHTTPSDIACDFSSPANH